MNNATDARVQAWRDAHADSQMVGWNFSALDGRLTAEDPPWDFDAECRAAMSSAASMVDLGTGGGERLIELIRTAPIDASQLTISATEGGSRTSRSRVRISRPSVLSCIVTTLRPMNVCPSPMHPSTS